ncbi:hypothetical protein Pfo_003951 [Paulownia fortunei]|nr:hypothetical protein Pfo_003951 [Paulownia fortunei]
MFTTLHFILLHSFPSNTPFPFLGVPPPGAHPHVRAPPPSCSTTMAGKRSTRSSSIVLLLIFFHFVVSSSESDAEILLKFKESLKNTGALSNWDNATPLAMLENMGLGGVIDVDSLAKLPDLRTMSFMNNNFDGSLPNLARLGVLKTIYLSNNKFSGEISPSTFNGMLSLKKLHLANNSFSGSIPATLAALPKLVELRLENNGFEGEIPHFQQDRLREFNASNNELVGEIPHTLSHFNASSFSGNTDLCGAPLKPCTSKNNLSLGTIIIVAILVAAASTALLIVVIILCRRKKKSQQPEAAAATSAAAAQRQRKDPAGELDRMERGQAAAGSTSPENIKQGAKLTFLKEGGDKFDMQDLLKASAEILGSGAFGSTYKAALNDGKVMVVKRFRQMNNVSKEEFNEHMRRLGRLSHQNVLPVVAFYYRKEEKLLVAEFMENVSLAVQLHGNRSPGQPSPDWPTRLNIVKGIAKGLLYLYNELPSLTAPHGHLKSSNVLLDRSFKPVLADYGLVPIVNQEHAQEHMISYKSPEYKDSRRITKKTDVWSLGILILEILTGKFPSNLLQQGGDSDVDLATWVESVMRGGGSVEVFDGDMAGTSHCQGEMMKLLKIGLSCCQADVDRRPDIKEAVEKIEEIKEKDIDDDFYSSYTSEADMRSSRGLSDDFKSINI